MSEGAVELSSDATEALAMCRVAIVDSNPRMHARLGRVLDEYAHIRSFVSVDAVAQTAGDAPLIIVIGPTTATPTELSLVADILDSRPQTAVVLTVFNASQRLMDWAASVGVSDVINLTAEEDQLTTAVGTAAMEILSEPAYEEPPYDAHQTAAYLEPEPDVYEPDVYEPNVYKQRDDFEELAPPAEDPYAFEELVANEDVNNGKVISVFSTKGGTGKSTVATNLAVTLAQTSNRPVVIVDADFQFGDVAVMMKLRPQHSISDVAAAMDRLDVEMLETLLVCHEASGVFILPSPFEPSLGEVLSAEAMVTIIDLLSTFAGHIIIDMPSHLSEVALSILQRSDKLLLVVNMDIPSVKDVKMGMALLRSLGAPVKESLLIVNRANTKTRLDMREIEKALHMKVAGLLGNDDLIPHSINKRVPAVLESPGSPIAVAMERIADLVRGDE